MGIGRKGGSQRGPAVTIRVVSPAVLAQETPYRLFAERVLGPIRDLAGGIGVTSNAIELNLAEPGQESDAPLDGGGRIWAVADGPPTAGLTEKLAAAYFAVNGKAAIAESPLMTGIIAGIANRRAGVGLSAKAVDSWARSAVQDGTLPSLLGGPAALPPDRREDWIKACTSFGDWLVKVFGVEAIREAIAQFDGERRDQAMVEAFRAPLGALEEDWHAQLSSGTEGHLILGLWKHYVPLYRPYRKQQLEALAYTGYDIGYQVALPLALAYLIDTVLPNRNINGLFLFLGLMFGLFLVDILVSIRRDWVTEWIRDQVIGDQQNRIYVKLVRLPHAFHNRTEVLELFDRIFNDVDRLEGVLWQITSQSMGLAIRAFVAAVTLVLLSPQLSLVCFCVVPLFGLGYKMLATRLDIHAGQEGRLGGALNNLSAESLFAHHVIKAFGLEGLFIRRYNSILAAQGDANMRLVVTRSLYTASLKIALIFGELLVYGIGGYMVIAGDLKVGVLVAFMGLMPMLFSPVSEFFSIGPAVRAAAGALKRINGVLDEPIQIEDKSSAVPALPLANAITFENVTFGYEPGRPILNGLTLSIPAGANVAIVGSSGCGKSTAVNLLMRFYDPDAGRILYDGVDLRDLQLESLRGQMGLVFQETYVFNSTIRENVLVGKQTAYDREVIAAASAARLTDYVSSLPWGYDTVVGEQGARMSEGQQQRLAIARAILRDPEVLILDEGTSALDTQTESELLVTLANALGGRTTISITHRLGTVLSADRIYVLDRGTLAESGTFDELMQADGLFRRLYERQLQSTSEASRLSGEISDVLARMPMFADLDAEDLATVANRMVVREYGSDTTVVVEGEPGRDFYVILNGLVDVVVGHGRRERHVATLGGGDYFGEMALITGEPRNATVRAIKASTIAKLSRPDFDDLLAESPGVRTAVERLMQARQRELSQLLSDEQSG